MTDFLQTIALSLLFLLWVAVVIWMYLMARSLVKLWNRIEEAFRQMHYLNLKVLGDSRQYLGEGMVESGVNEETCDREKKV